MPELETLLYRSEITNRIGPLHMCLLVTLARKANIQHNITGKLMYLDHSFVQCIEGPAQAVSDLWQILQKDPRHHNVELLARYPSERRRFFDTPLQFASTTYYSGYQLGDFEIATPQRMQALIESCLQAQASQLSGTQSAVRPMPTTPIHSRSLAELCAV